MAVSILHRVCGVGMATLGTAMFVWWLAALAGGPESYADFHYWVIAANDNGSAGWVTNIIAKLAAIGLTWAFFTHLGNGVRHFVMDLGAGYELRRNKAGAVFVMAFGVIATTLLWIWLLNRGAM